MRPPWLRKDSGVGAVPADEPTGRLDYKWVKKRAADGWLILDEYGNFIETFYIEASGDRIIADHNDAIGLRGRLAAVTELPDKLEADPPLMLLSPHNAHNAATWLREQLSVLGVPGEQ